MDSPAIETRKLWHIFLTLSGTILCILAALLNIWVSVQFISPSASTSTTFGLLFACVPGAPCVSINSSPLTAAAILLLLAFSECTKRHLFFSYALCLTSGFGAIRFLVQLTTRHVPSTTPLTPLAWLLTSHFYAALVFVLALIGTIVGAQANLGSDFCSLYAILGSSPSSSCSLSDYASISVSLGGVLTLSGSWGSGFGCAVAGAAFFGIATILAFVEHCTGVTPPCGSTEEAVPPTPSGFSLPPISSGAYGGDSPYKPSPPKASSSPATPPRSGSPILSSTGVVYPGPTAAV